MLVQSTIPTEPVCAECKEEVFWLLCAGQMEDIVSNLVHCNTIATKLKTETLPNPITVILESQQIIERIKLKSEIFLKNAKLVAQNISQSELLDRLLDSNIFKIKVIFV